jgi:hypothetical protein
MRAALLLLLAACKGDAPAPTSGSGSATPVVVPKPDAAAPDADPVAQKIDDIVNKKLELPDPFETEPFDATKLTGQILFDGKLVDIASLSPKLVLRTCPSDMRGSGILYIESGNKLVVEMDFELDGPKRKVVVGDHERHLHFYRGGRGDPEAIKGFVIAHVEEKFKLDVEFDADWGKDGHLSGRFTSGPPKNSMGMTPKCAID